MKSTELRIGNLLRDKVSKTELEVIELNQFDIVTYVIDRSKFPLKDGWGIEPIPLTEEWLLKFGFNGIKSPNKYIQVGLVNDDFVNNLMTVVYKQVALMKIQHVHQLQNLYFALIGEELTIKAKI